MSAFDAGKVQKPGPRRAALLGRVAAGSMPRFRRAKLFTFLFFLTVSAGTLPGLSFGWGTLSARAQAQSKPASADPVAPTKAAKNEASPRARSLAELLEQVRDEQEQEAQANAKREQEFMARRDLQRSRLVQAKAEVEAEKQRFERLQAEFESNVAKLQEKKKALKDASGDLDELFGSLRQIAGETAGVLESSLLRAQYPGREKIAKTLAAKKELPSHEEIEGFWQSLLFEMVKSGTVETFQTSVIAADGGTVEDEVLRVGTFNAFRDGNYLRFLPGGDSIRFVELSRQPPQSQRNAAKALGQAQVGEAKVIALDPSRGSIMNLLVQRPGWREQIAHGGVIGYIILALGALGVLIAIERLVYFAVLSQRMRRQRKADHAPKVSNPRGRLLLVAYQNSHLDAQTLLLRLEEVIQREIMRLRRGLGAISLFATTAPLLGLLGTVTGMIATFQSITLFGTGDPKMMSGGISQALVTTELGLAVSIPLLLLHSWVSQKSKALSQELDDLCTQKVAMRLEVEKEEKGDA